MNDNALDMIVGKVKPTDPEGVRPRTGRETPLGDRLFAGLLKDIKPEEWVDGVPVERKLTAVVGKRDRLKYSLTIASRHFNRRISMSNHPTDETVVRILIWPEEHSARVRRKRRPRP